jgi:hypothetical protein
VLQSLATAACRFRNVLHTTDLAQKYNDEDMRHLIKYWKSKEVTSPAMVEYVSKYVLDHCGGHVYQVLASMEYIFTDPEAIKSVVALTAAAQHSSEGLAGVRLKRGTVEATVTESAVCGVLYENTVR